MELGVREIDDGFVVTPNGEVDLSSSRGLQMELRGLLQKKPRRLVVDLADVPYMDSSGVATLVEAMQISRRQSTRLVLCNLQDRVRSIFEIARLDRVFTITETVDEATSG